MSDQDDTLPIPVSKGREFAGVFDRLIDSNIQLTLGVGRLVRVTYGVLLFNAVLVAVVIFILTRGAR